MTGKAFLRAGLAAAAIAGAAGLWAASGSAQQPTTLRMAPTSMAQAQLSFAPVVKRAAPAVVNIYTKTYVDQRAHPFAGDPFFDLFFGRHGQSGRRGAETSLGSGVIVGADGVIVTNAHVVAGADEITIALQDRREFPAKPLLVDEAADLAVLKAEASDLPFLDFADSDTLEVGDLVLAIGNPFGVGQTVTSGIISAQSRSDDNGRVFIQTDAAINPGNSGGALVDMDGRLAGVNSMILTRSGGSNGVGFAVPANLVRRALQSALAGESRVSTVWLGISGQTVTPEIAESLGLARPEGVILSALHPQSPLRAAGLAVGDVITTVDGRPAQDMAGLAYRFGQRGVGESAQVGYLRGGAARVASARLIAPPETPARDAATINDRNPLGGATIANLSPALALDEGFDPEETGVVVLDPGRGAAARLGFERGDVVTQINDRDIPDVAAARSALGDARGGWRIRIQRGGRSLSMTLRG